MRFGDCSSIRLNVECTFSFNHDIDASSTLRHLYPVRTEKRNTKASDEIETVAKKQEEVEIGGRDVLPRGKMQAVYRALLLRTATSTSALRLIQCSPKPVHSSRIVLVILAGSGFQTLGPSDNHHFSKRESLQRAPLAALSIGALKTV